ncbi:MAG: hypothetical protein J7501_14625 [Bdellovibrio sp.]|nr:hypothetical protein [Bdellovibrio sp.]
MILKAFTDKYLRGLPFEPEAERYLDVIESHFDHDFSTSGRGFFSLEDQTAIAEKAYSMAKQRLQTSPQPVTGEELRKVWSEVVTDFHRQNFWGFPTQMQKPKKELTEEQRTTRELWPYIWVMIQSGIILKTVVYYFGIQTSNDPTPEHIFYLVLALGTSAGTLIFFAWRKSRK